MLVLIENAHTPLRSSYDAPEGVGGGDGTNGFSVGDCTHNPNTQLTANQYL
jgi:hypothetical protein